MKQIKILLADDEEAIRDSLEFVLSGEGYHVDVAGSGTKALVAIIKAHECGEPYDVIVSDCNMPGLTGTELLREAGKLDPSLGFILISGSMLENNLQDKAIGGNFESIQKPFHAQELLPVVERTADRTATIRLAMKKWHVINSVIAQNRRIQETI